MTIFSLLPSAIPAEPPDIETETLTPPTSGIDDNFGWSVAIEGALAVSGVPLDEEINSNAGAAYIFRRDTSAPDAWGSGVRITTQNAVSDGNFGASVGITNSASGDYVIAGAPFENAGATASGAAYVFRRTGTDTWSIGNRVSSTLPGIDDNFGSSVGMDGSYAIAGAPKEGVNDPGAAYIFRRDTANPDPNVWESAFRLTPASPQQLAEFGSSVAIYGDYAVVGAPMEDVVGTDEGAAYVFRRDTLGTNANLWVLSARLTAGVSAQQLAGFGSSVAVDGDLVVVGAPKEDAGAADSGAAYVFRLSGTDTWSLIKKLTAGVVQASAEFGRSVDVEKAADGNFAVAGAPKENSGATASGAAHTYISGFSVGPISRQTTEGGGQAVFAFKPNIQPTGAVTIGISSSDTTEGIPDKSSFTFTASNLAIAVIVSGVNDLDADGDQVYSIILSPDPSPADARFSGADPDDVVVINQDDEAPGEGGGGGGGCFIATAAYGTDIAKEVVSLRRFRDRRLLTNRPGRALVELYYRYSPPVARFLGSHESARTAARMIISPIYFMVEYPFSTGLLAFSVGLAGVCLARKNRRETLIRVFRGGQGSALK